VLQVTKKYAPSFISGRKKLKKGMQLLLSCTNLSWPIGLH
jgi:hypothetical protein